MNILTVETKLKSNLITFKNTLFCSGSQ